MNVVGPAIYTRLTDDANISALVSSRVSPMKRPQGDDLPAITYRMSGGLHVKSHSGLDGLARKRVEIDCWGSSFSGVVDLAEKVRLSLDGQYGLLIGSDTMSFLLLDGSGVYEPPADNSDTGVHRVNMDFAVWHAEATS